MIKFAIPTFAALALLSPAALAASQDTPKPPPPAEKPITNRDVDAIDVAATPITDLNIRKEDIPKLLTDAQASPYATVGLGRCTQIAAAVGEFDAVLGDDLDLPATPQQRVKPGRVAQSLVGSLIPFRSIVRELSGANAQNRMVDAAIQAGVARRAFLKGYGEAKGCRYPARSATREEWNQRLADAQKPPVPEATASTSKAN